MRRERLSLDALPAWATLNGVTFSGIDAADFEDRGKGLVATDDLDARGASTETPVLLTIPRDLILSAEGVEEFAKENKAFRQLIDAAGHQTHRGDVLLFLLVQLVLSSAGGAGHHELGANTAWTQYFKMLPEYVSLPTTWSEEEMTLLRGTSLESSVRAKLSSLAKEFDTLKAKVVDIPFWYDLLCIDEIVTVRDWVFLDALYRSRSLELPMSGEAMVPCLDLANHSGDYTARFEQNQNDNVLLMLRDGVQVAAGDEVTISYGDKKSAAEMLFSYGFIEDGMAARSLVLPLEMMEDDPLLKAKLHVYKAAPILTINDNEAGSATLIAPFAHLMCVNEEDGLDFKIMQETDGTRHMRMFWQDEDITDKVEAFPDLVKTHGMSALFELRAVTIIIELLETQLERIRTRAAQIREEGSISYRAQVLHSAKRLQQVEEDLMSRALQQLEGQRDSLYHDDSVLAYLQATPEGQTQAEEQDDDDDFS